MHTDWTLHNKLLNSSWNILAKGQQDDNYLQADTVSFTFCSRLFLSSSAASIWKYSPALPANCRLVWYDQKDSLKVPCVSMQMRDSCHSIWLSPYPVFSCMFFSSKSNWLGIGVNLATWQGRRRICPTLQLLPVAYHPTHHWAHQVKVRLKHTSVTQQASLYITIHKCKAALLTLTWPKDTVAKNHNF